MLRYSRQICSPTLNRLKYNINCFAGYAEVESEPTLPFFNALHLLSLTFYKVGSKAFLVHLEPEHNFASGINHVKCYFHIQTLSSKVLEKFNFNFVKQIYVLT